MADVTSQAGSQDDDKDDGKDVPRAKDISKRAGVQKQLLEIFDEVQQGFADQGERADDLVEAVAHDAGIEHRPAGQAL